MKIFIYLFIFILFFQTSIENNVTCKYIENLETCSWINYVSWFPGKDFFKEDLKIGKEAEKINDLDCEWAYIAYFCASTFPKCNEEEDGPLPVCKETCYQFIQSCDKIYWKGISKEICDTLPETECTSNTKILKPNSYLALFTIPGICLFCKNI